MADATAAALPSVREFSKAIVSAVTAHILMPIERTVYLDQGFRVQSQRQ